MRTMLESISGAFQIAYHIALGPVLARRRRRWGATEDEIRRPLVGDELVPSPTWRYDHAVTIDAPRAAVWPWLMQLGQGRGGFYSYQGLENLVGCRIHNVRQIRPELQELHVGERIRTHASGYGPDVIVLDPQRALVLGGGTAETRGSRAVWGFHLFDTPGGRTRLIERGLNVAGGGLVAKLTLGPYLLDPIGFVMSRKMLRTIKRLAEDRVHGRAPEPAPQHRAREASGLAARSKRERRTHA